MNENELNTHPSENEPQPIEEGNVVVEPQDGITFKWVNLALGVAAYIMLFNGSFDWEFLLYLAIVVIIHELGHVFMGKTFGCFIREMQVFFFPFVSYKPKPDPNGSSWRDIKWSLGALPLGGVTLFSPSIEDKAAWQRLLIYAGGVLFNIATFLLLYFTLPYLPTDCSDWLQPIMILSLVLAVLNILPIYPLDGGAIVFALFEIITGRKPSPTFTRLCGWIGFILIILFFWIFPEWLGGILESVFRAIF